MVKKLLLLSAVIFSVYLIYVNVTPGHYQPIPCGCGFRYQTTKQYEESHEANLEIDQLTGVETLKSGVLCASCAENNFDMLFQLLNKLDFYKKWFVNYHKDFGSLPNDVRTRYKAHFKNKFKVHFHKRN